MLHNDEGGKAVANKKSLTIFLHSCLRGPLPGQILPCLPSEGTGKQKEMVKILFCFLFFKKISLNGCSFTICFCAE